MSDFIDTLMRLSWWQLVIVVIVTKWVYRAADALAAWLVTETVGPWLDRQGDRLARAIRRNREARS